MARDILTIGGQLEAAAGAQHVAADKKAPGDLERPEAAKTVQFSAAH
jgi:hypothetical protein